MPTFELTDKKIQKLAPPPATYWDSGPKAVAGLGLRVMPSGAKSWLFRYRRKSDGKQRSPAFASYGPAWLVARARKHAAELRYQVDRGQDPLGEAQAQREAPIVADLVEHYIAEVLSARAPGTQQHYKRVLTQYILPAIGQKKVATVERDDIVGLHRAITEAGHLVCANRVRSVAHTLFEYAAEWSMRPEHSNPVVRIPRNLEVERERYLSTEETVRLNDALDHWRPVIPVSVAAIRLLLLTGARRGEVTSATWGQFNLEAGTWTKPARLTKQRKLHHIPLSSEAVTLLRDLAEVRGKERVVPLRADERVFRLAGVAHERIERDWRKIRETARLTDVRLHDLRHNFASTLAASGLSLPMIGKLLGHTQAATTQRYAHLDVDPLRAAVALVGQRVTGKG